MTKKISKQPGGSKDIGLAEVRCPRCNRLLCKAELGMTVDVKCPRCKWHGRITVNIQF